MDDERLTRTPQQAFGARLRLARERRGISVKAVADTTKVTTLLFEALERGDISRWPKGLYKRSFFRGYVAAIGLPADSTVEEFLRLFPDEKPPADATAAASSREPVQPATPLRLTLEPEAHRVSLYRRVSPYGALDAAVVFVLTLVLVWWSQVDLRTAAAIVALCYYPRLARLARHQAAKHQARRAGQPAKGLRPLISPRSPSAGQPSISVARFARLVRYAASRQRVQSSRFEPHNGLDATPGEASDEVRSEAGHITATATS